MGGGWNNTEVVAFFYINNFSAFPVGLEELPGKSESRNYAVGKTLCVAGLDPADSGQDRGPLGVSAAERALDATESEPHSEGGWSAIRTMAGRWSEVKHGGGCGKAGSCRRICRSHQGLRFPPPSEPRLTQALARRPPTAIRHQDPIIDAYRKLGDSTTREYT